MCRADCHDFVPRLDHQLRGQSHPAFPSARMCKIEASGPDMSQVPCARLTSLVGFSQTTLRFVLDIQEHREQIEEVLRPLVRHSHRH